MAIIQFPGSIVKQFAPPPQLNIVGKKLGGVEGILQSLSIPVHTIKPDNKFMMEYERGLTLKAVEDSRYWVYIQAGLTTEQRQRTLCHELGHIVLGHMRKEVFPYMKEAQREAEAQVFAEFVLPIIYEPPLFGGANGQTY